MTGTEDLAKDYRVAFLHYLSRRDETALHRGYELGRGVVCRRFQRACGHGGNRSEDRRRTSRDSPTV